jgi:hypothetical protein
VSVFAGPLSISIWGTSETPLQQPAGQPRGISMWKEEEVANHSSILLPTYRCPNETFESFPGRASMPFRVVRGMTIILTSPCNIIIGSVHRQKS